MHAVESGTPGKSAFMLKPRNLKIARLLIEHGANPNLRIPNHDLVNIWKGFAMEVFSMI